MRIDKKLVNEEKGVVQITSLDERFYTVYGKFYPSISWISQYYPKGRGYDMWLAKHGWDDAQMLKEEAGARGAVVHNIIDRLIKGETVKMDQMFLDSVNEMDREPTPDEWAAAMSFKDFWKSFQPEIVVANETTVFLREPESAGTADLICTKDNILWFIDFKTSQDVWPSHKIQISAYAHSEAVESKIQKDIDNLVMEGYEKRCAILQIGYRRNQRKWKFTEIPDKFKLFESTYNIWSEENSEVAPKQIELPIELSLNDPS